jgi:dTDP-4-dehydrorhamnose reductase
MKIAVVGSSGYIAGYLIESFSKDPTTEKILRIDQTEEADEYLNLEEAGKFNFDSLRDIDIIVFTAAISGPDKCANEFDFCWKINVEGTAFFIEKAIKRNCKILFFSSDAVFGDIPGYIYTETSKTTAVTPYGKMKKAVEDKFKGNPNFKAIRLSYVASARDRFMTYCLNCIRKGETAVVFHPFYRNCIVVSDVVNVVLWLSKHWDEYEPFVLNVAGKEMVSRVRIADEINRIFDNKLKYAVSIPGDDFFKNRPKITQMRSLYMQKYKIIDDNTFTEKIQIELEDVTL